MFRRLFPRFDEFASSLHGADCRISLTGKERAPWFVAVETFDRLSLEVAQAGAANLYQGAGWKDVVTFVLPLTQPGQVSMNGEVLDERSMISLAPSESVVLAARAPNRWTSIFVPRDAFVSGVIGWDETAMATATGRSSVLPVDPTALDRVRCLALRLMRTAETEPRLLTYPAAARAADEELTAALFQTLGRIRRPRAGSAGRPSIPRRQLIARALEAAEADRGKSVYVRDLCRAAGVSERTLRNAFNEHFGFGPIHYLRVRRLHQWRAALRAADPRRDTVTGVGVRLGIWDFARLAQRYKALFGETPAQTLRACSLE